jgi:hypothetical protein
MIAKVIFQVPYLRPRKTLETEHPRWGRSDGTAPGNALTNRPGQTAAVSHASFVPQPRFALLLRSTTYHQVIRYGSFVSFVTIQFSSWPEHIQVALARMARRSGTPWKRWSEELERQLDTDAGQFDLNERYVVYVYVGRV